MGGRARQLKKEGFTFDIGPSWYWMPDVFDRFFADFGKQTSDYYHIDKLDPAYKIFFDDEKSLRSATPWIKFVRSLNASKKEVATS